MEFHRRRKLFRMSRRTFLPNDFITSQVQAFSASQPEHDFTVFLGFTRPWAKVRALHIDYMSFQLCSRIFIKLHIVYMLFFGSRYNSLWLLLVGLVDRKSVV